MEWFKSHFGPAKFDHLWFAYPQLYDSPFHNQCEKWFPFIRLIQDIARNSVKTDCQTQHVWTYPDLKQVDEFIVPDLREEQIDEFGVLDLKDEKNGKFIVPLIFSCEPPNNYGTSSISSEDVWRFKRAVNEKLGSVHCERLFKRIELQNDCKLAIDLSVAYLQELGENHSNLL